MELLELPWYSLHLQFLILKLQKSRIISLKHEWCDNGHIVERIALLFFLLRLHFLKRFCFLYQFSIVLNQSLCGFFCTLTAPHTVPKRSLSYLEKNCNGIVIDKLEAAPDEPQGRLGNLPRAYKKEDSSKEIKCHGPTRTLFRSEYLCLVPYYVAHKF